ncbi:MAG: cell division ATP-binding protein FtsE [Hyphomicrobiaceae bacterium]|nr:cell division ATP-binding protein FtsE [Hyphomicrobiaceae bacterium]
MIRLSNLALAYDQGHEVLAEVDFHLRPGSFHFLTGPSGAGKSSLLRLLFMSLHPTRGKIHLFNQDVSRISSAKRAQLRRRIGIVFQDFRLLDHLTTWENVALPLRVVGKRDSDYKEDVTDLLQWVGLGDRMHAFPSILSGGEKQRAAIARAVIGKPELLLADEPTGNLDAMATKNVIELLFKINAGGTAVLMATHDIEMVQSFGQRIIYLEDGKIARDREMIFVGDVRDRLDESRVARRAEQLSEHDIRDEEME